MSTYVNIKTQRLRIIFDKIKEYRRPAVTSRGIAAGSGYIPPQNGFAITAHLGVILHTVDDLVSSLPTPGKPFGGPSRAGKSRS